MTKEEFGPVFEQVEKAVMEQTDAVRDTLDESNEIRELIEAINDSMPDDEPFLYSGS